MLLGFKKRFISPIKIGTKVHTLRDKPKRDPKVGETLYMYSGLRTKHTEFIGDNEKLISKQRVRIVIERKCEHSPSGLIMVYYPLISIDGRKLHYTELDRFAQFDGFRNIQDFCSFWFIDKPKRTNKVGGMKILYHWTDLHY